MHRAWRIGIAECAAVNAIVYIYIYVVCIRAWCTHRVLHLNYRGYGVFVPIGICVYIHMHYVNVATAVEIGKVVYLLLLFFVLLHNRIHRLWLSNHPACQSVNQSTSQPNSWGNGSTHSLYFFPALFHSSSSSYFSLLHTLKCVYHAKYVWKRLIDTYPFA